MSVTRMKRRFATLRDGLLEMHASLDSVEEECLRKRDRLVVELDEILKVLSAMAEVYADHAGLSSAIGVRMDEMLDERLRLMEMGVGR